MVRIKARNRFRQGIRQRHFSQRRHRKQKHCQQKQFDFRQHYDKSGIFVRQNYSDQGYIRNTRNGHKGRLSEQDQHRKDNAFRKGKRDSGKTAGRDIDDTVYRQSQQGRVCNCFTSGCNRGIRIIGSTYIRDSFKECPVQPPQTGRGRNNKRNDQQFVIKKQFKLWRSHFCDKVVRI